MTCWLISANTKKYDHSRSFEDYGYIDWKQSANYQVGDIVYIYFSVPIKKIQYKAVVEKIGIPFGSIRDDHDYWHDEESYNAGKKKLFVRLVLLEKVDGINLSLDKLQKKGLKANALQRPKILNGSLLTYIESNFKSHTQKKIDDIQNKIFPDEIENPEKIYEGAQVKVPVNKYERSPSARSKCISLKGVNCYVCGMNFERMYGEIGKGFIHVHHLVPISKIGKEYQVNYEKDLIPVCPNCHAMLHRKKTNGEMISVSELKRILKKL